MLLVKGTAGENSELNEEYGREKSTLSYRVLK
jgi:hypothetical protein